MEDIPPAAEVPGAPRPLSATISISRKVNLGSYESADAFISVGNITESTTPADVEALLDGPVQSTWEILKTRLAAKVHVIRQEGR